jgi:hypothetical protein
VARFRAKEMKVFLMRLMTLTRTVTLASAAALAVAVTPAGALAQSVPTITFTPAAPTSPALHTVAQQPATPTSQQTLPGAAMQQQPDPNAPALQQTTGAGSYWEIIGGLEFDTDGTLFGFIGPQWIRPINENMAFTARAYANWLQYEFEENGGTTKVSGPGVSTQAGLRFGGRNWFRVGAGPSFTWRDRSFEDADGNETEGESDMDIGLSIGADAYLNPTDRDNIHALANYETTDDYLWTRLGYKRQITNFDWQGTWAHFLGAEGIWQGNDDIKTLMLGGLVEFVHAPSSTAIMLRAGFKRSTFEVDPDDRSGPYFGINFYKRLGS